jgi:hypothetical protein
MSTRPPKIYVWFLLLVLIVSNQACVISKKAAIAATPHITATRSSSAETLTLTVATPEARINLIPSIAPSVDSVMHSPTPSPVTITAVKGNLFIRRGPDLAYNPIALLLKGQSAIVLAHDVLGNWVEIPISTLPGKTGWVSIQTVFSSVSGNLMNMPEILPTDWPVPSYVRNCTHDQMIVEPGDTMLPSIDNSPDNEVWIYPGVHKVYDTDVDSQPEVLTVDLKEGMTVDVRVDGNGDHRKCP